MASPIITGETKPVAVITLVFLVPPNLPTNAALQWAEDQLTLGIGAAKGMQKFEVRPGRTLSAEEQQAALVGANGSGLRG